MLVLLLLPLAACAPGVVEPAADAAATAATPPVAPPAPALAAYPDPPSATATLPPYPWPTPTPGPTDPPEPTKPPTETPPPDPTLSPTPVVTPIPTAEPPFIPFPPGTTAQPFTLYWRDGDAIRSLRSDKGEPQLFLDPAAEFGLYLPPAEAYIRSWGAVSPDGQRFALVLTEERELTQQLDTPHPVGIYLFDRESRALRPLVKDGLEPVWSPDGKRLAYRSTATGGLWVAEVESGATKEVYKVDRENAHNVTAITWAPDNSRLAILDEVFYETPELFIIDSDQERSPQLLIDPSSNWVSAPQWSPTGNQLSFLWGLGERGGGVQLRIVDLTGEQQQFAKGVFAGGGPATWSPDGRWIAYAGTARYEPLPAQIDLWLVGATDAVFKRLTFDNKSGADDPGANDASPLWSPDGTQLAFRKGDEIWLLSLIDGGQGRLFAFPAEADIGLLIGR
jgi:Tol biopolymer transport system component